MSSNFRTKKGRETLTAKPSYAVVSSDSAIDAAARRRDSLQRGLDAGVEWGMHVIVVILLLAGFKLVQYVTVLFWGREDHQFFGIIPLRYVFDAGDLAILVCFLTYGVISAMRAYQRRW